MGSWYERGLPFLASCLRGVPFSPYARARAHARAVRCSSCCSCIDVRAGGWGASCGRAYRGCAQGAGRRAAWSAGRQAAWGAGRRARWGAGRRAPWGAGRRAPERLVGERTVATSSLALVSLGISGAAQQCVRPQPICVTASSQGAAPEEAGLSFNRGALRRSPDTADTHPARASLARGTWHMAHGTWHMAQAVRSEQADTHGPALHTDAC